MRFAVTGLVALAALSFVAAECPNACSGHGTCGAYDMCTCYEGFMANDCSQRICPFDLAHVDSPKGDLDMDGNVQYRKVVSSSQMYPDGTSELFPIMADASGNTVSDNTAHYYMECSNKGLCDRSTGNCNCFVGYEGASCQRASCPADCSGHGVCLTNRERAWKDDMNLYELWDADKIMSCDCDAGYSGYDCSNRECMYGIDPLYVDDKNTARVNQYDVKLEDSAAIASATGTFRLKFYDVFGEDWTTDPIDVTNYTTAGCQSVPAALESLPNDAIAFGSVKCSLTADTTTATVSLTFTGNPGALPAPEIIITDEVGRDTTTDSASGALSAYVYDTGVVGEFYDYFTTDCDVAVTLSDTATGDAKYGIAMDVAMSTGTIKSLKKCLGDSNGRTSDNVGVEDWDYGSHDKLYVGQHPHLVRLVSTSAADDYDGGVFAVMYYNSLDEKLELSTAVTPGDYYVYATSGVLERVWADDETFGFDGEYDQAQDPMGTAYWTQYDNTIYTSADFSCENAGAQGSAAVFTNSSGDTYNTNCLEKGDLIMLPFSTFGDETTNTTGDTFTSTGVAATLTAALAVDNSAGLYEIQKISVQDYTATTNSTEDRYQIVLDRPIFTDGSATFGDLHNDTTIATGQIQMFKFTPPSDMGYEYAAPCSSRGLCNAASGLCECFAGYTNSNCDEQSALAV